jgi:hypothetical protein
VTATFNYRLDGDVVTWRLQASGTGIVQAHFHQGARGANGPVVFFLFGPATGGVTTVDTCGTVTQAALQGPLAGNLAGFLSAFRAGEIYVNVHTVTNPAGAVRAQVAAAAAPAAPATGSGSLSEGSSGLDLRVALALSGAGALAGAASLFVLRRRAMRAGTGR